MSAAGLTDEDDAMVIVCQGPPICGLEGEIAIEAAKNGCPWCKRITIHDDGSETVVEPSRQ